MASRYLTVLRNLRRIFSAHFIGQLIILAVTFVLINKVFAAPGEFMDEGSQELPCSELSGVQELTVGSFFHNSRYETHRVLVGDASERTSFSWLEFNLKKLKLRFVDRRPGLGIPMTIYSIRVEWIAESGEIVSMRNVIGEESCSGISLFPGGSTGEWDLEAPENLKNPRLRVRIVASPY